VREGIITKRSDLSELADAIIDGYWILCTREEAIQYAIDDFESRKEPNAYPYTYNDRVITEDEFYSAIAEVREWWFLN